MKQRSIAHRILPLLAVLAAGGCTHTAGTGHAAQARAQPAAPAPVTRTVRQGAGKVVYWVLPGPRRLSPQVFGTSAFPRMTGAEKIAMVDRMVAAHKAPPGLGELLHKLPILVGVPVEARKLGPDGRLWFMKPNLFSDRARIVQGEFQATFHDVVRKDPPGPPDKTPDSAEMEAKFTDPAGNHYRVVLRHVVKPPFPGYETAGGVMLDGVHHGDTGTGSPLMPKVRTIAAFWGVGDVYINGELAEPHRVMHLMTTEVVRDRDYHLVLDEDLPLPPERRHIRDQAHHTHLVVLPITPVPGQGPTFKPLKTAFVLPNGMPQPFIHVMYEQDEVVQ